MYQGASGPDPYWQQEPWGYGEPLHLRPIDTTPAGLRARFAAVADPAHPLAAAVAQASAPALAAVSDRLAEEGVVTAAFHAYVLLAVCAELDPSLLGTLDPQDWVLPPWSPDLDQRVLDPSPGGLRHWFVEVLPRVVPSGARLAALVAAAPPTALHAAARRLLEPLAVASGGWVHDPDPDLLLTVHRTVVEAASAVLGVDLQAPAAADLAGLTPTGSRPEEWLVRAGGGGWALATYSAGNLDALEALDEPLLDRPPLYDPLAAEAEELLLSGVTFGPVRGFSGWRLTGRLGAGVAALVVLAAAVVLAVPSTRHALRESAAVVSALGSPDVAFDGSLSTQRPEPRQSYALVPPASPPTEQEVARLLGGRLEGPYAQAPIGAALEPGQAYVSVQKYFGTLTVDATIGSHARADGAPTPGLPTAQALARTRALLTAVGADLSQVTLHPFPDSGVDAVSVDVRPAVTGLPLGDNAFLAGGGLVQFDDHGPVEVDLHVARLRALAPAPLDSAATTWRAFEQHLSTYDRPKRTVHYTSARLVWADVPVSDPSASEGVADRLVPAWEFSHPDPKSTAAMPLPPVTVDVAADPAERGDDYRAE